MWMLTTEQESGEGISIWLANYLLGKNEAEKVETNDVQNIYHFLHILRLK